MQLVPCNPRSTTLSLQASSVPLHRFSSYTFAFNRFFYTGKWHMGGCVKPLCWFIITLVFFSVFWNNITLHFRVWCKLWQICYAVIYFVFGRPDLGKTKYILTHRSPLHLQPSSIKRSETVRLVSKLKCPNCPQGNEVLMEQTCTVNS